MLRLRLPFGPVTALVALLATLALAACGSGSPSPCANSGGCGTTTATTAGTGGSTGQGGEGGQGAGTFACKGLMCEAGKEECDVDWKDEGACYPLPASCIQKGDTKPTCDCFTNLAADCMCLQDPKGNFVIQCTMMM